MSASVNRSPFKRVSTCLNRSGVGATEPTANRISSITSSCTRRSAPRDAMAMVSALRRPTLWKNGVNWMLGMGIDNARRNSPFAKAVFPGPRKNVSRGSCRAVCDPSRMTSASYRRSGIALSAAGEALTKFPPSVPRFRICTQPSFFEDNRKEG